MMALPEKDTGDEEYESASSMLLTELADAVYDAVKKSDKAAFGSALHEYVLACKDE